jgi:FkbM family methyltransferase
MTSPQSFIIEIGTCDFETQAGLAAGLFIEPVKEYFDRLPATCLKENVAVSNYTGAIDLYFIPSALIAAHNLDSWLRGCNSVGRPHPTVESLVASGRIPPEFVHRHSVPVVRIKDLLAKHNITHIDYLKLDTEGHDAIILNDFLDTTQIKPTQIFFENNGLVPKADVEMLVERLTQLDYSVQVTGGHCLAQWIRRCV